MSPALEPIVKTLNLECERELAFSVFTDRIATWWPLQSHSVGQTEARSVAFEPRVGGTLYELTAAGERHVWGTVSVWQPPERICFSWHPGRTSEAAQTVEVSFREPEPGRTQVRLEHRGWELLGEKAAATREGYVSGWDSVLGQYVDGVAASRERPAG